MALALEPCDQERAHPVCRAPDEATQGGQARRRVAAGCGWQFEPKWDGFRCLIRRGWRDRNPGRRNAVVRSLATSPASRRVARAEACGRDAKCRRTADCVVGGFRYASNAREVGSLRLGLYNDEGKLDHVGFTATIRDHERQALTERLEALISPPGFSGNAPDGPSRWNTERTAAGTRSAPANGSPPSRAGGRDSLRPRQRQPLSPRHEAHALAPRQGAALVHLRADRAPGAAITADQTPSDVSVITQI